MLKTSANEHVGRAINWKRAGELNLRPQQLLELFEVQTPPVPVELLARKLGVTVHRVRQPGWDGALTIENDAPHIWVDGGTAPTRQRFTIAHELGHLLMHADVDGREVLFRDRITMIMVDPKEREANQFAAELLMPEWLLRAYRAPVDEMAEQFEVSPQAMGIRLQALRRGRSFE